MRLSYFTYSIQRHSDNTRFLFDIRPFLKAFTLFDNKDFKNSLKRGKEFLYLDSMGNNFFIFIMTRQNEIIKKIKSSDLTVSEIRDLLASDEQLGFAAYLYVGKSYLAFSSTVMAPRVASFPVFMDKIFQSVGLKDYSFIIHPLLLETDYADAVTMSFLGKANIQLLRANSTFEKILASMGVDVDGMNFSNIESLELVVRPARGENIKAPLKTIIENLPKTNVKKFVVKAKKEEADRAMDLFLAGSGILSDSIKKGSDSEIMTEITKRISENIVLKEKVAEHEADDAFRKTEPEAFMGLHNVDSWAGLLCLLPAGKD